MLSNDHKSELIELLKETDSLEVFWFPFNSLFDKNISLSEGKTTLSKGIDNKEIALGKITRVISDATAGSWKWNPWNDELWSREINFTTDPVTEE